MIWDADILYRIFVYLPAYSVSSLLSRIISHFGYSVVGGWPRAVDNGRNCKSTGVIVERTVKAVKVLLDSVITTGIAEAGHPGLEVSWSMSPCGQSGLWDSDKPVSSSWADVSRYDSCRCVWFSRWWLFIMLSSMSRCVCVDVPVCFYVLVCEWGSDGERKREKGWTGR